jgi:hypothetical protein
MRDLRTELRRVDDVTAPDLRADLWSRVARPVEQSEPQLDPRRKLTRRRLVAVAAPACLLVVAALWALWPSSPGADYSGGNRAISAAWLTDPGQASCVEQFSVEALGHRSWAFDGTILEVVPPRDPEGGSPGDIVTKITFGVHHWYAGGSGDSTTVLTYSSPGTVGSDGGADPSLGARILASGEDRYVWGCGFTMPYNESNAEIFSQAFS